MKIIFPFTLFIIYISTVSGNAILTACEEGVLPEAKIISAGKECTSEPCVVFPGTTVSMQMNFTAPKYLDFIKPQVVAHYIIDIPIPLDQDDACEGITNTPCPIAEKEKVNYEYSITLFKILPSIQLGLTFSIVDTNTPKNKAVVCFHINLEVQQDPKKATT